MKTIVTGGAGFIGSHIVDRLIQDGHEVMVIDNESSDVHEQFYYNEKAEYIWYDVQDYYNIEHLFKDVDWVFHLAAESRIQPCVNNPVLAMDTNTTGTCSVLQAAKENGVKRFIFSSTSAAYGIKNDPPLTEDMPNDCLNAYSISKTASEELCKMYYRLYGLETVIFRYFNVYGERQPLAGQYAPVIGLFQTQVDEGLPMTVIGDGLQTRDFTHVSDVVNANIKAATTDNKRALGETFNVGTGKSCSVMDLVGMIGGDDAIFVHMPARIGECRHTKADISKTKRILEWEPQTSLEEWLT